MATRAGDPDAPSRGRDEQKDQTVAVEVPQCPPPGRSHPRSSGAGHTHDHVEHVGLGFGWVATPCQTPGHARRRLFRLSGERLLPLRTSVSSERRTKVLNPQVRRTSRRHNLETAAAARVLERVPCRRPAASMASSAAVLEQ